MDGLNDDVTPRCPVIRKTGIVVLAAAIAMGENNNRIRACIGRKRQPHLQASCRRLENSILCGAQFSPDAGPDLLHRPNAKRRR